MDPEQAHRAIKAALERVATSGLVDRLVRMFNSGGDDVALSELTRLRPSDLVRYFGLTEDESKRVQSAVMIAELSMVDDFAHLDIDPQDLRRYPWSDLAWSYFLEHAKDRRGGLYSFQSAKDLVRGFRTAFVPGGVMIEAAMLLGQAGIDVSDLKRHIKARIKRRVDRSLNSEECEHVVALKKRGNSYKAIAAMTGLSRHQVVGACVRKARNEEMAKRYRQGPTVLDYYRQSVEQAEAAKAAMRAGDINAFKTTLVSDCLELSVRFHNMCRNNNIMFMHELLVHTEDELLRTPNFGRTSLKELKSELDKIGLALGMDPELFYQSSANADDDADAGAGA